MSNKYTNELYERIKDSFSDKKGGGNYKNVLRTKPENTYLVRLIPNVDDPSKTRFQYYTHGWNSPVDGRYVSTVCPTTYEEECPICTERFRLWNKGDEASKELSKNLARKERYYANVYVIDDPENEENNGTVKILGYGRQIAKVIDEAMTGDDADEIGGRMFDFSKEGCNLRIKVEKNKAGYPTYERSKFVSPSDISVSLEDIADQLHDFDPLLTRKTTEEMKEMLETALYGLVEESTPAPVKAVPAEKADDIPMEFEPEAVEVDEDDILKDLDELNDI